MKKNKKLWQLLTLWKKINQYLSKLTPRQKRTVLTVVKTFAEEEEESLWEDKEFISMLDNRITEYETGKIKPSSRKQLEAGAKKAYKLKYVKGK
ncbi:MAG: hypothetical protein ABI366_00380 [Ginsengibacter sp.]